MNSTKEIYFLENKLTKIKVDKGELISFVFENVEIMHQKGDAGWKNTDIEMFPVIGATKTNNYNVTTPKGIAKMDQHGLLRLMQYKLVLSQSVGTTNLLCFSKTYKANTPYKNLKFPEKSSQEFLHWPYDFEFLKTFELINNELKITFEIKSEENMPFMLGYHPAFKIYNQNIKLVTPNSDYKLPEIIAAGSSAFYLENCNSINVINNGTINLKINTKGFKHFMLWTAVTNMVCIEPITFYPDKAPTDKLHLGFNKSLKKNIFEVRLKPLLARLTN